MVITTGAEEPLLSLLLACVLKVAKLERKLGQVLHI